MKKLCYFSDCVILLAALICICIKNMLRDCWIFVQLSRVFIIIQANDQLEEYLGRPFVLSMIRLWYFVVVILAALAPAVGIYAIGRTSPYPWQIWAPAIFSPYLILRGVYIIGLINCQFDEYRERSVDLNSIQGINTAMFECERDSLLDG